MWVLAATKQLLGLPLAAAARDLSVRLSVRALQWCGCALWNGRCRFVAEAAGIETASG